MIVNRLDTGTSQNSIQISDLRPVCLIPKSPPLRAFTAQTVMTLCAVPFVLDVDPY